MTNHPSPTPTGRPPGELFDQSVAGEEDPGASVDAPGTIGPPGASVDAPGTIGIGRPGDEAPAGTPGTGEKPCSRCGGAGRLAGDKPCPTCSGTGKITAGIGGG